MDALEALGPETCGELADEFDRQARDERLSAHERLKARARSDEIRAKGPTFLAPRLDLRSSPLIPGTAAAVRQEARKRCLID